MFFTKKTSEKTAEETNCKKTKFAEGRYGRANDEAHHLERVYCIFKITSFQSKMSYNDKIQGSDDEPAMTKSLSHDDVEILAKLIPGFRNSVKLSVGHINLPPNFLYLLLDGRQLTRKQNFILASNMARQDYALYQQLVNQLANMKDAAKNNQVFEWMLSSGLLHVHFSSRMKANIPFTTLEQTFDGVTYLEHPYFEETDELVKEHMHEFFMEFVASLDSLCICQFFEYVDTILEDLKIEWSTRMIFPNVKQFAAMARKVHSLYQDKSTTKLPQSLQEFGAYIGNTCISLAWSIEDDQLEDILQFLREFAGPVAGKLFAFHMNHKFYSVSGEEKKNMLMKRNDPPGYITVNGKQIQMSLKASLIAIYTDCICGNKDPEFNTDEFLVRFYAHGEAERIELLGWLNTLPLTKTGNDLIYNVGTNYIIVYFLSMIFDTAQSDGIPDTADLESDGGKRKSTTELPEKNRDAKQQK